MRGVHRQLLRFGIVGVLNTLVDFGILNLFVLVSGVHQGPLLILFNTVSFSLATWQSFHLNRCFTFRHRGRASFWRFAFISFSGLGLNDLILLLLTGLFPLGLGGLWRVNLGKAAASIGSLAWNFLLYRRFVFRAEEIPGA